MVCPQYSGKLPQYVYMRMRKVVLSFLWGTGRPKVAYYTLIGKVSEGGLGLLDPQVRMKSLRVKWVRRFLDGQNTAVWKYVMEFYLRKCGNLEVGSDLLWMSLKYFMTDGMPCFYRELLGAWGEFLERVYVLPRGRKQLLGQPLFLNRNITNDGGPLFFRKWWDGGIRQVRDLLYEVKEGFLPTQVYVDAIGATGQDVRLEVVQRQLGSLMLAIPTEWIAVIEQAGREEGEGTCPEVHWETETGEKVDFITLNIRRIYKWFRDRVFVQPAANKYWKERFGELTHADIWGNIRWKYMDPLLEDFTFLQRHNCLLSEMRLCKMGLQTEAACSVCGGADEGLFHLFLYCPKLDVFLYRLRTVVRRLEADAPGSTLTGKDWEKMILFGPRRRGKQRFILHLTMTVARYSIWSRRNVAKHRRLHCEVWPIFVAKMKYFMRVLRYYFSMHDDQGGAGDEQWQIDLNAA